MSKPTPFVLRKVGSGWQLWLDVDTAKKWATSSGKRWIDGRSLPAGAFVPMTKGKGDKGVDLGQGSPMTFKSKSDAEGIAHQVGHYALGLGSFVHTYVSEAEPLKKKTAKRQPLASANPFRGHAARWFAREKS